MAEIKLSDLGGLSEPAKTLIEKISDAVGGLFKPYQIERVAKAEAEAEKTKAIAKIEISELEQRAFKRFLLEEASKQENIERITQKALPQVKNDADPNKIERDWLVDYFDKARLISDEEMREVWARVLAGEANQPGKFKKRTIHLLAGLDKADAILFSNLCNFVWQIGLVNIPLVLNVQNPIYAKNGLNFLSLKQLDSLGLISFESVAGYRWYPENDEDKLKTKVIAQYGNSSYELKFSRLAEKEIQAGHVLLTQEGIQLFQICTQNSIEGFEEYVLREWSAAGIQHEKVTLEE